MLGPAEFEIAHRKFVREELEVVNPRGLTLQCSWYRPEASEPVPVIIYLHGNSGCRADADDALHTMLPYGVSVFTFDFAGSGQSDGDYVSLGYFEQQDVRVVVEYLRATNRVSTIGLWGRSMGAATAILYAKDDPSVAGMVLDSPFSDLPVLCEEVASMAQIKVPKSMLKSVGMPLLKKSIFKRAGFDIAECSPLKHVEFCFVPALFVHGEKDDFILPRHSEELCERYAGEKNRILVKGNHNTVRPSFMRDSASIFFAQCLGMEFSPEAASFEIPVGLNTIQRELGADAEEPPQEEEDEMARAIALSLQEHDNMEFNNIEL